ncbi:MAG: YifB family Mg chelatase-like AAA ATPase [Cyclobacteriaceae bacterium]
MVAKTYGGTTHGVDASIITVETNIVQGTKLFLVGLPDNAVKESQQRVESVIKHLGYYMPRQKTVINLAPADVRKEGSAYDLPIALSILKASGQIAADTMDSYIILGELSLDGIVRPIKGSLPIAIQARKEGLKGFILPKENAEEAAIVNDFDIIPVENIKEAIDHLSNEKPITPIVRDTRDIFAYNQDKFDLDFADVQGQDAIKRALEVAAAGGHNAIMVGPPGSGKTMLAKRVPSILPPLSLQEALETTKIHSVAGKLPSNSSLIAQRPFSSPHHTISDVALVGGGNIPQPGQISLAHNGILFLDELPEFKRTVLEVMRQPLEERVVTISRAKASVSFPANFMLIASMNPSPSGDFYTPGEPHADSPQSVQRYLSKISGPLLDRIDLHIEVTPVPFEQMTAGRKNERSTDIRERVIVARERQIARFKELEIPNVHSNAMMPSQLVKKVCVINSTGKVLLKTAMEKLGLSARAYDRILKVSRTIADLADNDSIQVEHLAEAIQYRSLDRDGWGGQ